MRNLFLIFALVLQLPSLLRAQESAPVSINEFVMAERITHEVPPVYPPLARSARVQGTVILTVHVGKDGTVLEASPISGHPLLVNAAIEAVSEWRYRPVMQDGRPVDVITAVSVPFSLKGPNDNRGSSSTGDRVREVSGSKAEKHNDASTTEMAGVSQSLQSIPKSTLPDSVFVLLVYREDGVYSSSAVSEERAFQDLVSYVRNQWAMFFPALGIPSDDEEAVDRYFAFKGATEDYEIIEHELLR